MSNAPTPAVELLVAPEVIDLGGFDVRRILPAPARRMLGPFIFFDHFGPVAFPPGEGIQVRPHPHIGLSTVTYLFEGEILHRDSLGNVQPIQPGAVNLMTAGRGIVHSERSGDDLAHHARLHGIQSWTALPIEDETREPDFAHYPAAELPLVELDGVAVRIIVGEAYGQSSPVLAYAPTLYLDCRLPAGSELNLPQGYAEQGIYLVEGCVQAAGVEVEAGLMAIARADTALHLEAVTDSHVMVVGGANLGRRHIWWNFVSSSRQRIEQAKQDWRANRFAPVPGETEFIPLPD